MKQERREEMENLSGKRWGKGVYVLGARLGFMGDPHFFTCSLARDASVVVTRYTREGRGSELDRRRGGRAPTGTWLTRLRLADDYTGPVLLWMKRLPVHYLNKSTLVRHSRRRG